MARLPHIPQDEFARRILDLSPEDLPSEVVASLFGHYEELRRWAGTVALIGPGTAGEVLERHFGESLMALPLIPPTPPAAEPESGTLLDVGSGAGFPGLVLAAARPAWRTVLVESRQKKWAFLMSAARRGALSCRCLNARVGDPLPGALPAVIDRITARAIRLPVADLALLLDRLSPAGRALFWAGESDPDLPPGWTARTAVWLPGSEHRRIVEVTRGTAAG